MQNKLTSIAHERIKSFLSAGSLAIDATCGNGHDTIFLAKNCGETGKVFAYDIQIEAVENTKNKLQEEGLHNVVFYNHSHEYLVKDLSNYTSQISVIIFNLGYLPGGNKSICTQSATTLSAIDQSLSLIKQTGIISILTYPGHSDGLTEDIDLLAFLNSKNNILDFELITKRDSLKPSPKLYILWKK